MAKFSGQITLAEVQKGEKGTGIRNIVSWYQIFPVGIKPMSSQINKDTFKLQNAEAINDPNYNWVTTPSLPTTVSDYLWTFQEIIFDNGAESQLTEPVICGNAVTAVMNEYSVDGRVDGPWDKEYKAGVHMYIRFSYDGGATWTTPIKIVGLDGTSTATTVYSIIPDYGEVLKFMATDKEIEEDSKKVYTFAPDKVYFSLKKSSATSDTIEPIYVPFNFREEPIPSDQIDKEERGTLYSHLTISYLSKSNQNLDGTEANYWAGIDLERYKEAFFDYINGQEAEPRLMLNLDKLWELVTNYSGTADISFLGEIFSEETLIKFELGYWDLITTEASDGTLVYEERKQTFSTFIPIRFAMNKDLARFSVNAHDIHMSIAQAGLKFNSSGLELLNGNFRIVRTKEDGTKDLSLQADQLGNVTLRGRVEAESGIFNGEVYAQKGVFKGSIYAGRGNLGSLNIIDSLHIENLDGSNTGIDIGRYSYSIINEPLNEELIKENDYYIYNEDNNAFEEYDGKNYDAEKTVVYRKEIVGGIKSSNYSQDKETGFFISANGSIYANNLFIGSNARIENSLKIGDNCYILNPTQNNKQFIKVVNNNGQVSFGLDSTGKMNLGDIEFDGENSSIYSDPTQSSTYGWSLTPSKATFNNIVARGSIEASVFKYGEVTAVGGILLARPASKVSEVNLETFDDNGVEITIEDGVGFFDRNGEEDYGYCLFTARNGLQKIYLKITEIITDIDSTSYDAKDFKIKVKVEGYQWSKEQYIALLDETLVYLGKTASYTSIENANGEIIDKKLDRQGSVGICINGSDDSSSFTSPRAITVYTLGENYDERTDRIILGQIPNESERFGRIAGTYGLYGENVYLKGALVTESSTDKPIFSGISTIYSSEDEVPTMQGLSSMFPNTKELGRILLWAGAESNSQAHIEAAKFKVDEYGNMYAGSGFFDGSILTNATIEAAKIRTAVIEGTGLDKDKKFGLTIHDVENGIQFTQTLKDEYKNIIYEDDNVTPKTETVFSLTNKGIEANVKLKVNDLEITGSSPLNLNKLNFSENRSGLGMKPNYLSFWNNGISKIGYLRMEEDGLGLYYNGQATIAEGSDDWENMIEKELYKTVSFGNNIIIGNKKMGTPPELVLWGGIAMGEAAQVTRVEGGFDINIL